jgi:hypothetical protein
MILTSQIRLVLVQILYQNNYSPHSEQILSITCDNASANDAMITHLAGILNAFPGEPNRTRCFAHILNLVAKCVMKQFDAPKKKKKANTGDENDSDEENIAPDLDDLRAPDGNLDIDGDDGSEEGLDGEDDEVNGEEVQDGREGMSAADVRLLEEKVKPVRQVLTKVCNHPINN